MALGLSNFTIMTRHVLPNAMVATLTYLPFILNSSITTLTALDFLGFGLPPPTPSWGALLKDGYSLIRQTPWLVVGGGLPIILATLGFTFLGESLRDVVDPKLRKQR